MYLTIMPLAAKSPQKTIMPLAVTMTRPKKSLQI
jgi:hypothetical protein